MNLSQTLVEAVAAIRRGFLTPLELVDSCLERIEQLEPAVSAWVTVEAEAAREQAEQMTRALDVGVEAGPLYGIPIGIKDIVDVVGMPTRAGSPLTSDQPASADATVVTRLREAGAIILGKTVTTPFACFDPPPTRNPWNEACTPGGSSSGSAAALAVGMCTAAIGTQTGGSITRPASYCGVAGLKPTFGRVSRQGIVPVSFHLDHVGTMARSIADCGVMLDVIAGPDPAGPACSNRPPLQWQPNTLPRIAPLRMGVLRPYFFDVADAETVELVETAIDKLEAAGGRRVELPLPEGFDRVLAMHRRIMACEAADYHRRQFGAPRDGYPPLLSALIEEGLAVAVSDYQEALVHQLGFHHAVERSLAEVDVLVVPATPTAAPDRSTTGDPSFNAPWSYAGVPTAAIPCGLTAAGLPVSLQLIGRPWDEAHLLDAAYWCERELAFDAVPPLLTQGAETG